MNNEYFSILNKINYKLKIIITIKITHLIFYDYIYKIINERSCNLLK